MRDVYHMRADRLLEADRMESPRPSWQLRHQHFANADLGLQDIHAGKPSHPAKS
ncbi:MAG TPA: hypothetical protein VFW22_16195 [Pseudolabrys sp.]|nr:hypothetical protein [Pseudolabrys sp.]